MSISSVREFTRIYDDFLCVCGGILVAGIVWLLNGYVDGTDNAVFGKFH